MEGGRKRLSCSAGNANAVRRGRKLRMAVAGKRSRQSRSSIRHVSSSPQKGRPARPGEGTRYCWLSSPDVIAPKKWGDDPLPSVHRHGRSTPQQIPQKDPCICPHRLPLMICWPDRAEQPSDWPGVVMQAPQHQAASLATTSLDRSEKRPCHSFTWFLPVETEVRPYPPLRRGQITGHYLDRLISLSDLRRAMNSRRRGRKKALLNRPMGGSGSR